MEVKVRKISAMDLVGLAHCEIDLQLNAARQIREPILKAFDVYKVNVLYGAEKETQAQKKSCLEYLQKLKDLDHSALTNVPSRIKYYM